MNKKLILLASIIVGAGSLAFAANEITRHVFSSGGGEVTSARHAIRATLGEPVIGKADSARHSISAGFWIARGPALPGIEILHGNSDWDRNDSGTWVSFNNWAFGGYIDPKVESTDGVNVTLGLNTFNVVFNIEPFGDASGGPVTLANVSTEQTGGTPPNVVDVTKSGNIVTVELDRNITLQEWTTLVFAVWNADGAPIVDNGNEGVGIDELARLDVGFLPSDVNNSGASQPLDLSRWITSWNGGSPIFPGDVEKGHPDDYLDISRGSGTTPLDLARVIAALKGQAPFTRNWRSVGMNNPRP